MSSNSTDRINRTLTGTTSRRQALKLLGGGLMGGAMAGAGFAAVNNAAAQPATGTGLPVTGTVTDTVTGSVESFAGTLNGLVAFVNDEGTLSVSGALTGLASGVVNFVTDLLVTSDEAACDILFLELGPLELNVLGLEVLLSQITLDVNAVPGAGNLLGNLLCAVAGLLDNPSGNLNGIANLLNRIFRILG